MLDRIIGDGFGFGDGDGYDPLKREHDAIVELGRSLTQMTAAHVDAVRHLGDGLVSAYRSIEEQQREIIELRSRIAALEGQRGEAQPRLPSPEQQR